MSDDQSNTDNSEHNTSSASNVSNLVLDPPPSSGSNDDYDDDDDEHSDYSGSGFGYGYRFPSDESDWYDDEEEEEEDLCCRVCQKQVEMAVVCEPCLGVYCRRDAIRNVQLMSKEWDRHDEMVFYACNVCLERTDNDVGEWREGKVLTLEMLCALNIARKMWETIYPDESPISYKFAMSSSFSIMNSVDQSYSCSPLVIKNLIKQAVFLLGLELDFFHSREDDDEYKLMSVVSSAASKSDDESSEDNEENGRAKKRVKIGATCWERYEIEWTPQFTIRKLDYLGI